LIVPPANVTVEPELAAMLPSGASLHVTRLPGKVSEDTSVGLRERFEEYNRTLATAAASFGGASLSVLCLGVTGCCYLVGPEGEKKLLSDLRSGGVSHVVTAARAIRLLLEALGRRRIALVTPYPAWVIDFAKKYWLSSGFEIAEIVRLPDVVSIYAVNTAKVVAAAEQLGTSGAEAIVLSGTGVATLPAIEKLAESMKLPVISSNLSLGWWVLERLDQNAPLETSSAALRSVYRWLRSSSQRKDRAPMSSDDDLSMQPLAAIALLETFANAYNRHDVDGIMAHMTEDCSFLSYFGPDACGERFVGFDKVRQRVAAGLAEFPDARWENLNHFISGNRGVSEWTFRGTRRGTTEFVERCGLDIFTFKGGKIHVKNTYQKWRKP
jgi:maleate cis-trans isomerase